MKVFVTGGTGFTGSRVVPLLLTNGHQVRCLHRPTSGRLRLLRALPELEWVEVSCLSQGDTIGKSYTIAGKHPLTYNKITDTIACRMDTPVLKLQIPSKPFVFLLRIFERMMIPFFLK